jgi:RNA polymerase sigma-70 factor, ECF subfamily
MLQEDNDRLRYEWLVLRCQAGDRGAFADLIGVMERPLLYYATSLTGNQDAALDVLQEVWLKVVRSIRKLKDPGSLKPWLYAITHGIAVDRIRRDYSRERVEGSQVEEFDQAVEPSFANEDAAVIHQALSQIGIKHREVLVLYFLQDLSIDEVASVIGCSSGTVKSRMHYAKQAMKQILQGANHGTAK